MKRFLNGVLVAAIVLGVFEVITDLALDQDVWEAAEDGLAVLGIQWARERWTT